MLHRYLTNNSSFQGDEDNATFHPSRLDNFTDHDTSAMSSSSSSSSFSVEQDDWTAAIYYAIANWMYIIGNPLLTIVGSATNLLTLVVMSRKSFRSTSVAVYLSATAVSDTLVLITDFLNNWVSSVPRVQLLGISDAFCKFHRFFFCVVYTYSAWLVTALCVERFVVVSFPFKAKVVCNRRTAVVTVVALLVPIFAVSAYNVVAWYADGVDCVLKEGGWTYFQSELGPWISGLTYSYLPSVAMLMLNTFIVGRLTLASRLRRKMALEATTGERKELRLTVTIVVISVLYVTMTVPCAIYYTVVFHLREFTAYSPRLAVVRSVVILVASSSYVSNFFLYVLSSRAFRKELSSLFCRCRGGGGGRGGTAAAAPSFATGISTVTTNGGGKGGGGGGGGGGGWKGGSAVPKTGLRAIPVGDDGEHQIAPGSANPSSATEMTF